MNRPKSVKFGYFARTMKAKHGNAINEEEGTTRGGVAAAFPQAEHASFEGRQAAATPRYHRVNSVCTSLVARKLDG